MAILSEAFSTSPGTRSLAAALDIQCDAETAFSLLCAIEKWPVWLSFVRSAELTEPGQPLAVGSEILIRSALPGEPDQLFEVEEYISNYRLSLVGAYSVRRRLDFRVERKTTRCKVHVRIDYPAYGGKMGALVDALRSGRKLATRLDESLVHFKGLAEYDMRAETVLDDF